MLGSKNPLPKTIIRIFALLRTIRDKKTVRLPTWVIILGMHNNPKMETAAEAVYKRPTNDSGILVARKDELIYTVSATWKDNKNPVKYIFLKID